MDRGGPVHSDPLLDTLLDVRTVFDSGSTLVGTLQRALDDVGRQSAVAWVALPEPDGSLVIEHVLGHRTDGLHGLDIAEGQGLTGRVFSRAEVHWVDQYAAADSITHEFDTIVEAERVTRMIAAPLGAVHDVFGVLTVGRRDPGQFADATIAEVEALARRATWALQIARSTRDLARAAALAERRRISEELHDGVGALLFSLSSRAERLGRHAADAEVADEIATVQAELGEVGQMVRSLVEQWHATASTDLQAEVQGIVEDFEARSDIRAVAVFLGAVPTLDAARRQAVTRLVGVALSNVERHAEARGASVTVTGTPTELTVAITNDGPTPAGTPRRVEPGVGLGGAHERITRLGGTLTYFHEDDGTGFTVRARIPL